MIWKNQILIQKQVTNSLLSGVIFSRTPENGAPYFVINYTIGSSTDAVTKGLKTQTVKIYRNIKKSEIPIKWKKLISAIIEIEKIFKNNIYFWYVYWKTWSNDPCFINFWIKKTDRVQIF